MVRVVLTLMWHPTGSVSRVVKIPYSFGLEVVKTSFKVPKLLVASSTFEVESSMYLPSSRSVPHSFDVFLCISLVISVSRAGISGPYFFTEATTPTPLSPTPDVAVLLTVVFICLVLSLVWWSWLRQMQ